MKTAVFKNNFYSFLFEDGLLIDFEEIHPKALYKYNLKEDDSFIDKSFKLTFSEVLDSKENDVFIYRIDSLKLI
ncbi:hypothetical protein [Jejuia spongiicola]|uniref:Uncharacterized protein n=1 Tax=Jejuia spongiicola TaxID=2942207 RepID=A0ABT0QAU6_9FLAO|nr:hypothetical protein [Jejuia spongiicola]MCL6294036.1 hypothetical protein [Jejuia spongiicola]